MDGDKQWVLVDTKEAFGGDEAWTIEDGEVFDQVTKSEKTQNSAQWKNNIFD